MIARTLLVASAFTLGALALPARADTGVSVKFGVVVPAHVQVVHAPHHGYGYGYPVAHHPVWGHGHPGRADHHWKHERKHAHWYKEQRRSDYHHHRGDRDRDYGRQNDRGHGHERDNRR